MIRSFSCRTKIFKWSRQQWQSNQNWYLYIHILLFVSIKWVKNVIVELFFCKILFLRLFQTTINVGPFWHYLKFPLKYVLFSLHNKKVICLSHCLKKKMRKTAVSWHFHQSYFFRNNMLFSFSHFLLSVGG